MIDDALAAHWKKWLRSLLGQWAQALTLATCHQDGIDWEVRLILLQVHYLHDVTLLIKDRDEEDSAFAEALEVSHIKLRLLDVLEVTMHDGAYLIRELYTRDETSADVAISKGSHHLSIGIYYQ